MNGDFLITSILLAASLKASVTNRHELSKALEADKDSLTAVICRFIYFMKILLS